MMRARLDAPRSALALLALAAWLALGPDARAHDAGLTFTEAEVARILEHSPLPPPPPDPTNRWADDPRAARFGQALFFDVRLSANGELSCASCHDPSRAFSDGRAVPRGMGEGTRNAPSLWNAAHQRWLFWDGRADSLWAQAAQPLEGPTELGGSRTRLARTIAADPALARDYAALFGPLPEVLDAARFPPDARPVPGDARDPAGAAWSAMPEADRDAVTRVLVCAAKSIAAYERRLASPSSPFDRFAAALRAGDPSGADALSPAAQRGLRLFVGKADCRLCHTGPAFTDAEFHDLRIAPRDGAPRRDAGRHAGIERLLADPLNAAGRYSDAPDGAAARELGFLARTPETWGQFRTPSLRNVAQTAPYGHAGEFARLADVVRFYSTLDGALPPGHHGERVMRALALTEQESADLVAFLESLTGDGVDPALLGPPPDAEPPGDGEPRGDAGPPGE